MKRLSFAQRVILVVALGALLLLVGHLVLGGGARPGGWVAYEPLRVRPVRRGHRLVRIGLWLLLLAVWTGGSLLILRDAPRRAPGGQPVE